MLRGKIASVNPSVVGTVRVWGLVPDDPMANSLVTRHPWDTPWPALSRNVCFAEGDDEEAKKKAEAEAKAKADAELQEKIKAAVAKETEGLKATNEKLKQEKTALTESAKAFEGLDPEEVKRVMDLFANNEEAQLIKDGKFEELVAKKTDRMQREHAKVVEKMTAQITALTQERDAGQGKLSELVIGTKIRDAATKAEILPSAIDDALYRGRSVFQVDAETGEPVALDGAGTPQLSKDGKSRLSIGEWVESMKDDAPHWWATSSGGGAGGSKGANGAGGSTVSLSDQAGLNQNIEAIAAGKVTVTE